MSLTPAFKIGEANAWIFMSVFLLQMLAIGLIDKRSWERSHVPVEARRSKSERYAGTAGNFVWLLAMGYSVFLPLQLGTLWFYAGLSVFAVGLAFLATATFNFIAAPANQLIQRGAYRLSRHPMYSAAFLICLGSGIAAASWLFVFLSMIMALCLYREALIEERYCLTKYGKAYQEYQSRTPRWIGVVRGRI